MRTIRIRAEPYTEPSHSDVVSGRDCFGETLCSYNSNEQFHIRAGEFHSVLCPVKYQLWWLLSFFLLVCSTSACTFCLFCEVVHCDKQLLLVPFRVRHQNVAFLLPFRLFITNMHLFLFLSGCSSPTVHPFLFLSSLFIINMCLSFRLFIVNMWLVFKAVNSAIAGVWTFGIAGFSFAYFVIIIISQTMSSSITMACTHTLQTEQNVW